MTQSPVLFLVFNRPEPTSRVFEAIREARPSRLYVAADGPRPARKSEAMICEEVRRIATHVDWPCEVKTLFRTENLGCKMAVSGGITWFFETEERGIILEDDCLPNQDFFSFCDTLLARYADDERVWVITGGNSQRGIWRGEASYYFSRYNHYWGWASWRRAWPHYQGDLPFWSEWRSSDGWHQTLPDPVERSYWQEIFDQMSRGEIDSWGYPWTACVWYHGGLTATPNVNLVTNIGFGEDATHTKVRKSYWEVPLKDLGEVSHPDEIVRDSSADRFAFDNFYRGRNRRWPRRGLWLILTMVRRALKVLFRP